MAALGLLAGVLGLVAAWQKSRRETERCHGLEKARDVEHRATDTLTGGLQREEDELARARRAERLRNNTGDA